MKKKICLFLLGLFLMAPNVSALTEVAEGSWATYNEGTVIDSSLIDKGYEKRTILESSLYAADASEENGREQGFTGIGYFGEEGVIYYFNKYDEDGNKTHNSLIVGNPDETQPDLTLTEVTWDGDNSTWIGEGVEVWAVNYNGTGEDKLVAYAYNKLATIRAQNAGAELVQVEGAKIEFAFQSDAKNLYDTLVYFPDDFVYCSAIRVVDITETLKQYGGNGQNVRDGYDLDALYGYKILYIPVEGVEYQSETAISVGKLNLNCEDSWQKAVMKVATSDLTDGKVVTFDIIAGQHYLVGTGEVYLDGNGEVKVRYNFNTSYDLVNVNDVKVGIYKNYSNMLKDGKLLGNGQLIADEKVTLDDEYAYIRLHLDVEIPTHLVEKLEYVEEITSVCEVVEEDKDTECNKDKHKDKDKECNKDKHKDKDKNENKHDCNDKDSDKKVDKNCNKDKDCNKDKESDKDKDCNKDKEQNKTNCKKKNFIKKTCNSVKKFLKKCFSR